MIKKTLLLFLIFAGLLSYSQNTGLEKLKQELQKNSNDDTAYINRINNFLLETRISGDSSLPVYQQDSLAAITLSRSKKINYTKGTLQSLYNLISINIAKGDFPAAQKFAYELNQLAEKKEDKEFQVRALLALSSVKILTNDSSALNYLLKAEEIAKSLPDKKFLANTQSSIGQFYTTDGSNNYAKAMEWLLKSVRTSESINDLKTLGSSWNTISTLYIAMGDYEKALSYLKKADKAFTELGIKNPDIQNGLGEIYRLTGKYPEAIAAYKKGMSLNNLPYNTELFQSNLADVYLRMDSLSHALEYANKALEGAQKINDISGIAWIYSILSRSYLKKNESDSALYFATLGLKAAKESNYLEFLRDNSKALANAYEQKKNYEKAYYYHNQFIAYRDSMQNTQSVNKANLLQHEYEMAKTDAHIAELNAQKRSQRNFLITALSLLGVILIIATLLLRNNRQKQKANKLLQQSYNNVELLKEIGRKITSSLSIEKIIGTVYKNVNDLMDANVLGIGIYNESLKRIDFPFTYEQGQKLPFYFNILNDKNRLGSICFNEGREINMGNINEEYKNYIQQIPTPHAGGQPASVIYLPLESKGKKLGVLTVQSFKKNAYSDYHLFMLRNIAVYTAIALENASSYETLKSTQQQLIQSEKMASLGELTAGIAHEIQNPLNFVNNFSEINQELLAEMKQEIDNGNFSEVKIMAEDIIGNEEKIAYHGKRADAIVKGMLQHSRSSSGQKELTDINSLCDEYLRLAYHGLRAKDKSFNAKFNTNFDPTLPKIEIVPQDIGRVILNLINNAFYAVNEKKKEQVSGYEPTVTISTKNLEQKIQITVKDNGNGIAQEILDKIFQPFFTTKPSGEGTGLGLSLTYDIITKTHGGELKVETKEGEGSEFIILLPL